jgi:hypothetical protein
LAISILEVGSHNVPFLLSGNRASISGHKDYREIRTYVQAANKARMATEGMAVLAGIVGISFPFIAAIADLGLPA